jgi:alpha-beta hydrolase superfamily lysophospholipase
MSAGDLAAVRAVIESDLTDLDLQLEREQKSYQRHLLWLVLGVSPGALLPMLFVLSEFGGAALVAVILTVGVLEGWRAFGSKRTIRRLETMQMELRERLAEVGTAPSIPPVS